MQMSIFRRSIIVAVLLAAWSFQPVLAQSGPDAEESEEVTAEVDKAPSKAERPSEPAKHVYSLELLNVRAYKTVSLLQKQLADFLERGALIVKTKATWSQLMFEVRTTMNSNDIKNGLLQMQLEETKLKSVSFDNNRFTVEFQ